MEEGDFYLSLVKCALSEVRQVLRLVLGSRSAAPCLPGKCKAMSSVSGTKRNHASYTHDFSGCRK